MQPPVAQNTTSAMQFMTWAAWSKARLSVKHAAQLRQQEQHLEEKGKKCVRGCSDLNSNSSSSPLNLLQHHIQSDELDVILIQSKIVLLSQEETLKTRREDDHNVSYEIPRLKNNEQYSIL
jgi:hypothetical protein